jgi:methylphosphotriester-DNA--protein-cysteine methyltransferase
VAVAQNQLSTVVSTAMLAGSTLAPDKGGLMELVWERTRTALMASRARGRIGGRPPALNAIKVRAAKAMLASGTMTVSEVARQVGCSSSTLYRHVPGGRTAVAES